MAQRLGAAMKNLKQDLRGENAQEKARSSALNLVKLWHSRQLRVVGSAFRAWHLTTWRAYMHQKLTQMRSDSAKALQRAHEATAAQAVARRRAMLRGLLVQQLRFRLGKGFDALREAAWSAQDQVCRCVCRGIMCEMTDL